jgi:hypothetical protein
MAKLGKLTDFLDRLDDADLHYTLTSVREAAVLVGVTLPGERWEVEFMKNGDVEIERFKSDGEILDYSAVKDLFQQAASED